MTDTPPDPATATDAPADAAAPATPDSLPASLRIGACGLAMGVCDAVPGVSGGTMALILGIYEDLIGHIANLVAVLRRPRDRETWRGVGRALRFLLPLGIGAVTALLVTVKLLVGHKVDWSAVADEDLDARLAALDGWLVNQHSAPLVFAFFFGLVLASIREPWSRIRVPRPLPYLLLAAIGALASGGVALAPTFAGSTHPALLLGAGALAISVMLLPGISGSLALLVLGMYQPISQAASDRDLGILVWVVAGMALGMATFVPALRWALQRRHDQIMAVLAGLMAGSLVALWPWKTHYVPDLIGRRPMEPLVPQGDWWWPLLAAGLGAALIILLSRVASRRHAAAE